MSNTNMVSGVSVQVSGKTVFSRLMCDLFLKPDTRNLKPINPTLHHSIFTKVNKVKNPILFINKTFAVHAFLWHHGKVPHVA